MANLHTPFVTTLAASALGLIFVVLSANVVVQRNRGKVLMGEGHEVASALQIAIRSHANFAEYVPLSLILIGLIEIHAGHGLLVHGLALALVLARVLHPIGMRMPGANPFRAAGFILSVLVILVGSVAALLSALG
jgi:uncharacterized membrane protein YecN with MAPEG domain